MIFVRQTTIIIYTRIVISIKSNRQVVEQSKWIKNVFQLIQIYNIRLHSDTDSCQEIRINIKIFV